MSGLTTCNYCTLKRIERDEARNERPHPVTIRPVCMPGGIEYWTGVYVGDNTEPIAYFRLLTTYCAC